MLASLVVWVQTVSVAKYTASWPLRDGCATASDVATLAAMYVVMHISCVDGVVFLLSIRHI